MSEITRKLAARRAKAEGTTTDDTDGEKPWNKPNRGNGAPGQNGSESPKTGRTQFQSSTSNGEPGVRALVSDGELDRFKQEIIQEVRKEISQAKKDILDAIKVELNRR